MNENLTATEFRTQTSHTGNQLKDLRNAIYNYLEIHVSFERKGLLDWLDLISITLFES